MNRQLNTTAGTTYVARRIVGSAMVQILFHGSQRQNSSWINQIISGVALTSLSFGLLADGKAEAVSFTFEKVADTNTPIPGGKGNFEGFSPYGASLDDGNVAFRGSDASDIFATNGIYTSINGELNVVADTNTPIPGGTTTFALYTFSNPSLDNGNVAFSGFGDPDPIFPDFRQGGVYTNIGGKLNVVADKNTRVPPDGIATFYSFGSPSLDNGSVAFSGVDAGFIDAVGVYTNVGGELNVVADQNTPVPGSTVTFNQALSPSLDDGNVAFEGQSPGEGSNLNRYGIYANNGGTLNVVADTNTPIPGGTGNFEYLSSPSLDNENVAFLGARFDEDSLGNPVLVDSGIYTNIGGTLKVIADTNTPIPGGTGTFNKSLSNNISLDDGNVAFLGFGGLLFSDIGSGDYEQEGIYTNLGGVLAKVIAKGDLLDGKKIDNLEFEREGLSGNQIAFNASFTDNSQGIYIATVPEPASALGTLAFGTFGAGWLLRQRQKNQKVASSAKPIKFKT